MLNPRNSSEGRALFGCKNCPPVQPVMTPCPPGFQRKTGDIPESLLLYRQEHSLNMCTAKCVSLTDCLSFSYSHSSSYCKLMASSNPTTKTDNGDFVFCSKSKSKPITYFAEKFSALRNYN